MCPRHRLFSRLLGFALLLLLTFTATVASANCQTPRQAMRTLIDNLQPERSVPELASKCFDFGDFKGSRAEQLEAAVHLKSVLDSRGLWVYYEKISDDPAFKNAEGSARFVAFPNRLPEMEIVKSDDGAWRFSATTVAEVPRLYNETFAIGLEKYASQLPVELHSKVLGVALWQYLAVLLLLFLALPLGLITSFLLGVGIKRLPRAAGLVWVKEALGRTRWPITMLVAAGVCMPGFRELGLPIKFTRSLMFIAQVVAAVAILVLAWRLVDVFARVLAQKATTTDTKLDDQLVPLVRKMLKVAFSVLAMLFVLQNLDIDVGSLVAGLGIGGLAFALAAKDTLANLFGSLTIFLDRPFQIGDWVIVGGVEGTVEEVGFRSTRVRTFYKSVVTVPNSKVADSIVDNMGARSLRRLKFTVGLTYDTTPDQMRAYVEGLRAVLLADPAVWKDYFEVHFVELGASSLNIMVYAFLDVATWTDELVAKQNILLESMNLARELNVGFAFPTQSIHIESDPSGKSPFVDRSAEDLRNMVQGFGPGGSLGRRQAGNLTPGGFFPGATEDRGSDNGE